eukprot:SAG31_NODE_18476_length_635_cov_0.582090_2_plen_69_part_00
MLLDQFVEHFTHLFRALLDVLDSPAVVMSMPLRRRSLFRAVNAVNNEYDPAYPASQYGDGGDGAFVRP